MKQITLLNSGGLDTALMAKKLKDDGFSILSIYVDSGQLNREQSLKASKEIADRYCDEHIVHTIDYGEIPNYLFKPTGEMLTYKQAVESGDWTKYLTGESEWSLGVTPAHWHTNFSVAYAYSQMKGITEFYSAMKDILVTKEWIDNFQTIPHEGSWGVKNIAAIAPISQMRTYQEVADWANADLKDFSYTYSCRLPEPCGFCDKCKKRAEVGL